MEYAIEMKDIRQEFSGRCVLNGIGIQVKKGEVLGLLGPSGAGKTTIIKILTGQLHPTGGSAALLGADSGKIDKNTYRKIGTMLDNLGLYERLSVYDNLKLFARIYGIGKARIEDALARTGLADAKMRTVSKLSKGMKSRVVLARAIMNEPELLFLDEPTSGLDPSTAKEIHTLLRAEQMRGATIFLTTHNMAEATKLCDNVALLHEGTLIEYGSPTQICQKYNHLNRLRIQLKNGESCELNNDASAAARVAELLTQEQITAIHSTEPDLESVFIERTGKGLE